MTNRSISAQITCIDVRSSDKSVCISLSDGSTLVLAPIVYEAIRRAMVGDTMRVESERWVDGVCGSAQIHIMRHKQNIAEFSIGHSANTISFAQ